MPLNFGDSACRVAASAIGMTIKMTNACRNGPGFTKLEDSAPSSRFSYTGNSSICTINSTGVAASSNEESDFPRCENVTT